MSVSLWSRLLSIETSRIRGTNFFPPPPSSFKEICIGTKSRNLGDALVLTPLFLKLKQNDPEIKLSGFIRAFNPVVLKGFPFKVAIRRGPKELYGDDVNLGSGHLIQQKLQAFGLDYTVSDIRPVLFLSDAEINEAEETLKSIFNSQDQIPPFWVIHPWGKTWRNLLPVERWQSWMRHVPKGHHILQIGVPGEDRIPGTFFYEINPRSYDSARALFAVIKKAFAFMGIDSGPMHIAAAFRTPSLIFVKTQKYGDLSEGMKMRNHLAYFHPQVRPFANLYSDHLHLEVIHPRLDHEVESRIEQLQFIHENEKK